MHVVWPKCRILHVAAPHVVHAGPYITFPIWGAMSLAEVENMAALQSLTLELGNFGNFRCFETHSGAF